MQALFYLDLATKKAQESLGGSAFKFPPLVYGENLNIGLRFSQKVNGKTVEASREVRELRATIGKIDARPEGGKIQYHIGSDEPVIGENVTTELAHNAKASTVETALNALSITGNEIGEASVELKGDSLLITFAGEESAVDISAFSNSLFPLSFARVRASEFNGEFVHDVRLIQAPVAATDLSARVVPPAPSIETLIDGGENGETQWPEVQKLHIPATFRGVYQIRREFAKTRLLDRTDGAEEIGETLNASLVGSDEAGLFETDLPTDNNVHISFKGDDMIGVDHPPLQIEVFDAPEGDLTFNLNLNTPELHTLLRQSESVTLPIEIEADIEDVNDSETVYTQKLYSNTVTISRELHWEELSTAASIDWLRAPLPKNYVPFSTGQISNGQLHYSTADFGDSQEVDHVFDHNLQTSKINVIIHPNAASGSPLSYATPEKFAIGEGDFTYDRDGDNSVEITFRDAPDSNEYLVTILALELTSYFDLHGHGIAEILGLQAILDDLGSRVLELESRSGDGKLSSSDDDSGVAALWNFADLFEVFPSRKEIVDGGETLSQLDQSQLGRSRGLLAAVHDVATESITAPLSVSDDYIGRVFENTGSKTIILAGGKGLASPKVKVGEFAACDGRVWYKVTRYNDAETSFYPVEFERELFTIHVNEKQLRLKKQLEAKFAIELAVLKSNTAARWSVVIEVGEKTAETDPATTGANINQIVWSETPLLEQEIIVTPNATTHRFGARVTRKLVDSVDTLTSTALLYGASEGGGNTPASANFALRARLIRFDTENNQSDPLGFTAIKGLKFDSGDDSAEGTAVIN